MSDDLVKRLRSLNTFEWMARPATTKETCFAAADRIEKLEAALRQLSETDLTGIARKALEGKDD